MTTPFGLGPHWGTWVPSERTPSEIKSRQLPTIASLSGFPSKGPVAAAAGSPPPCLCGCCCAIAPVSTANPTAAMTAAMTTLRRFIVPSFHVENLRPSLAERSGHLSYATCSHSAKGCEFSVWLKSGGLRGAEVGISGPAELRKQLPFAQAIGETPGSDAGMPAY